MNKIWVVVKIVNAYEQYGAYFVGLFIDKPTFQDLKRLLPEQNDTTIGKLTRGGGRQDIEDEWFSLMEVESGINYDELMYELHIT